MEAERWKQVDELLQSALQVPLGQRNQFLRQACAGDAELEQEVRSLLASHQNIGGFLESPAIQVAAQAVALAEGQEASDSVLGQTISHYRVLRKLGSGGMGAVYEAEDLRLGRHVALKLLLESQTANSKALMRFEHEARAVSSLNHPHICTLYEVEDYEGKPAIVMELLEGETLKQRMKTGRVPLNRVVQWGTDVADALDAAHAASLIHRDIKPANIFITIRGRAKVLDFGLAKLSLSTPEASVEPQEDSLTSLGVIPGTTPYMSPEQVRGDELDSRTDLFSLGVVMYEMATGERPFAEKNVALTMDAVLHKRPAAPSQVNPELPQELERIIVKALEKDLDLRYQSAADLGVDLSQLKRDTDSGQVTARPQGTVALHRAPPGGSKLWKTAVLATAVVLAVGLGIYTLITRSEPVPFRDFTITQITDTGKASAAAISPDGKYISNVQDANGAQSLWLRNIATGSDTQIIPPAPERYQDLAFSPDGNYVYFLKTVAPALRNMYRVPVLGGIPQLVAQDVDARPTFSPDAQRIAFVRGNNPEIGKFRLLSANPDGSDESVMDSEKIENVGNNGFPIFIAWSNDGKRVAYGYGTYAAQPGLIKAFDLDRKHQTLLARFPRNVLFEMDWLSKERLMVLYSETGPSSGRRQVGLVSIDRGKLQPVTRDTNGYSTLTLSADRRTAATVQVRTTRTLELRSGSDPNLSTAPVPRAQVERVSAFDWTADGNLIVSDGSRVTRIGADGVKQVALIDNPGAAVLSLASCANGYVLVNWAFYPGTEGTTIWRLNSDGSNPKQITHGTQDTSPACTPDGKWVYYLDSLLTVMRVPVEGGQAEVVAGSKIPNSIEVLGGINFSPDGKHLIIAAPIYGPVKRTEDKLAIVDLDARSGSMQHVIDPDPRMNSALFAGGPRFSFDGKAVVYAIVDAGVWNLWMQPLDGSPGRQITNFSSERIGDFRWSPDGKTLAVTREWDTSDVVLLRQSNQ